MPVPALLLLTAALCVVALRAQLRWALCTLLATWLLVPGTLALPGASSTLLAVPRLVLYAFAIGMVLRAAHGELARGAFRPTYVHAAFAAFLALTFLTGVALAGDYVSPVDALSSYLRFVDQAVLFVTVLAAVRSLDVLWVARAVGVLVVVTAFIGIVERVTGWGWSPWFFAHVPAQHGAPGAADLVLRGGAIRARGAAQFALEYAWVTTMLLPLVIAVSGWARRRLVRVAPAIVLLAIVWSSSRSALIGIAAGAIALVAASRADKRVTAVVTVGVALAIAALVVTPSVRNPFVAAGRTEELSIRTARLPLITQAVADRPYQGLGLSGLAVRGIPTTDISYVLMYATTGIVGLLAFCALLVAAVRAAFVGLRAPPGPMRAVAAAIAAGVLLVPIAAAGYDLSSVPQSTWALWILVALAISVGEEAGEPAPARRRHPARLSLPIAGALAGMVIAMMAPTHVATSYQAEVVSPYRIAANHFSEDYDGELYVNTACGVVDAAARTLPGTTVDCQPLYPFYFGPGLLRVRVQARDAARAREAAATTVGALRRSLPFVESHDEPLLVEGRPTIAHTAPVWMAAVGLLLALFVPPLPDAARERLRRRLVPRLTPVAAPVSG